MGSASHLTRAAKKNLGSFYTPAPVVDFMVAGCLDACDVPSEDRLPTLLDPACGDGAFLRGAFAAYRQRYGARRAPDEVLSALHGVDIDAQAISQLQSNLRELFAADPGEPIGKIARSQILAGDALSGADFSESVASTPPAPDAVNWAEEFPLVAARGGFDIVIGNPPYRRELQARELFERLSQTPLGRRWKQARMDLWYYFLHRSLDLLQPGGILSFIVPSYWTQSRGAGRLIERLARETTFSEIVLLDKQPVFPSVAGRHLIFRLRKGKEESPCEVWDCGKTSIGWDRALELIRAHAGEADDKLPEEMQAAGIFHHTLNQSELFGEGRLHFTPTDRLLDRLRSHESLSARFEVRQGIAENPAVITARLNARHDGRYGTGAGVFVLTGEECAALPLSPLERSLLRPYDLPTVLGRYRCPPTADRFLLYLTPRTMPDLAAAPAIWRHLEPYRPILEQRREVARGQISWWHLHWPREERLFLEPKILSLQMGVRPQFVFVERSSFVRFSVNVIAVGESTHWSLPALTGILNSAPAARWFGRYAKQRGVQWEISGQTLREFPLPAFDPEQDGVLTELVVKRQEFDLSSDDATLDALERRIDEIVRRLYGLD